MALKLKGVYTIPVGGHQYSEHGFSCNAESFDEVVALLREYRENNTLVIGDPKNDVLLFYAGKFSNIVEEDFAVIESEQLSSITVNVNEQVEQLWRDRQCAKVRRDEQVRRSSICAGCAMGESDDGIVSEANRVRLYKLSGGSGCTMRVCTKNRSHCIVATMGLVDCKLF